MLVGFLVVFSMWSFSAERAETVAVASFGCLNQESFWAVVKELEEDKELAVAMLVRLVEIGECRFLAKGETVTVKQFDGETDCACIVPAGEMPCYWTANDFIAL